ncbi:MAG: malonyl-CoA synthase [Alphaproteobacteria bacterium]|nr:malonyl-CoA synthase [Alphaproteobacteria bacterium]
MNQSVFALIADRLAARPDRVLIEADGGADWTWADIDATTARYARLMDSLGLRKGDRVAVQVDKSPEALLVYLACNRAGLVYLPMNTAYREDEIDFLLGNARPGLFVCRPEAEVECQGLAARNGVANTLTLDGQGRGTFTARAAEMAADFAPVACGPDDDAGILYTSGTTGKPKGAVMTQRNLSSNALALVDYWGFRETDVLLHALPVFHTHGLFVACHCALFSGAKMLWLPKFDAARVLALLPRATVMMGVPTFYTRLLATPEFGRAQCGAMRLFVSGSAPLLEETHKAFEERTGMAILERYGMTETGMITSNPLDGERRAGTVGFPLPGIEVRIGDDADTVLATDEVGVIQMRGPNVFKGYWGLPEKTAEEFTQDGWFRTGDVGKIDARGYVHIVGRAKDLIISGGFNVYPKEIEGVIDRIEGVLESAVIGIPHPDFGEAAAAIVVRQPGATLGEDDIIAHIKTRIANYKVPKHVKFLPELPRNTMGKVQKNVLRDTFDKL